MSGRKEKKSLECKETFYLPISRPRSHLFLSSLCCMRCRVKKKLPLAVGEKGYKTLQVYEEVRTKTIHVNVSPTFVLSQPDLMSRTKNPPVSIFDAVEEGGVLGIRDRSHSIDIPTQRYLAIIQPVIASPLSGMRISVSPRQPVSAGGSIVSEDRKDCRMK